jgi:hypothetical protein
MDKIKMNEIFMAKLTVAKLKISLTNHEWINLVKLTINEIYG